MGRQCEGPELVGACSGMDAKENLHESCSYSNKARSGVPRARCNLGMWFAHTAENVSQDMGMAVNILQPGMTIGEYVH
jgi:hypothetical protein